MSTLDVNEIFRSIQGEGFHSGRSATFIRLSGCNLVCDWCDTEHSTFVPRTVDEVVSIARHVGSKGDVCVITGGEPLIQDIQELCMELQSFFRTVAIETNGTIQPPALPDVWITMSPKDPNGSWPCVRRADEIKVVVPGNGWTNGTLQRLELMACTDRLFFQPQDGPRKAEAEKWMISATLKWTRWRASVQLHKILGLS